MKRKIYVSLVGLMLAAMMLAGCGKDVSKMEDEELYAYLMDMDEDEREDFIENLDNSQQYRAYEILTKAEIMGLDDEETDNWDSDTDSDVETDESNAADETVTDVRKEYEPTEEIINATPADGKVQIADTVFQFGGVCTLGEFVERYSDEWYFYNYNDSTREIDEEFLETFMPEIPTYIYMELRENMNSDISNRVYISLDVELPSNVEDPAHVKWRDALMMYNYGNFENAQKYVWYAGGIAYLDTGYTWENYTQYFEKYGYGENSEAGVYNDIEGYHNEYLTCLCNSVAADGRKSKITYEMEEEQSTGKMINFHMRADFPEENLIDDEF